MYIYYVGLGGIAIVLLWALGSYLAVSAVEKPTYTILEKRDGYEVREYQKYIVAETMVTGDRKNATSQGFQIIADYIFGNNVRKQSIAMTSPVLESEMSEKISMTSPVLTSETAADERTIAFILPSAYTLENLPTPNNPQVTLREVPAHKVAVLSFTWYATTARVEAKKALLIGLLERDKAQTTGEVQVAQYNPPLSMPLVLRNEIVVPIK